MLRAILALIPVVVDAICRLVGLARQIKDDDYQPGPVEPAEDVVHVTEEQLEALRRSVEDGK